MLLNRAVSSIFLVLNTLSLAEPYAVDNNQRLSLSRSLESGYIQVRTNNSTQINTTTSGDSHAYPAQQIKIQGSNNHHNRTGLFRHTRSRRKHHNNEFAQQPPASAVLPQNTQARISSFSSRLLEPTDQQTVVKLPVLNRQKRLLLNTSSNLISDPYLHRHHHSSTGASSPTTGSPTNMKPADGAPTITLPLINETTSGKDAPSYNLSNSTDPYGFSTETPQFALPTGIQVLMCILYGSLAFTAITSNMIVCYIVLSNQRMRTATNYFIVNLAVGDILMALLCIPFTFPANLVFQYWPFGLILCVVVSYSQANSVFISAYTMVAISIDKYLAIMYPMRVRMTKTQAKNIILVIWSAALITSLPTAILSRLSPAFVDLSTTDSVPMDSQGQAITTTSTTTTTTTMPSTEAAATITARHSAIRIIGEQNETSPSTPTSLLLLETTTQMMEPKSSSKQEEPFTWQNKYFCQESWTFWPKGKYIYSMALMVLQFVVPLFVLVITYSRIVVVVWGKKMPGEEDNARDARMARSKRKMIKMVILCVIAFALTWLPFNVLIVIGDMKPDIWEHQNIMYIWFITHYLAMCHTITNPLIYIWMNNRFRAGFKEVISDLCRPIVYLLYYIWFHFCCLGCILNCSRSRYLRGVSRRELKRRSRNRPTSTTVNLTQTQNNHTGSGGNNRSGFAATNNNTNNNTTTTNNNNNNIDGHNESKMNHRLDNNNGNNANNNDTTTCNNNNNNTFSRSSREPNASGRTQTTSTTWTSAAGGYPCASTSFGQARGIVDRSTGLSTLQVEQQPSPGPSSSTGALNTLNSTTGRRPTSEGRKTSEGSDLDLPGSNFDFENGTRNCEIHNRPLAGPARGQKCSISTGGGGKGFESVAASIRQKLKRFFWWRHRNERDETENGQESNDATVTVSIDSPLVVGETAQLATIDSRISPSTLLLSKNLRKEGRSNIKKNNNNNNNDDDDDGDGGGCGGGKRTQLQQQERERKKKKRDKQSHVISIRMTAVDYYRKPLGGSGGGAGGGHGHGSGLARSCGPSSSGLRPMDRTECRSTTTAAEAEGHVTEASFVGCKQSGTNRKQSRQPEAVDDGSRKQLFRWDEEVRSTQMATKSKMSIGRLIAQHGKRQHRKRCPSCRAEAEARSFAYKAGAIAEGASSKAVALKAKDSVAKLKKKLASDGGKAGGRFVIDLHQSSQSTTPTTSTNQTNITGLICSPANSSLMSRCSGNFIATSAIATTNGPPLANELANSSSISSGNTQAPSSHQSAGGVPFVKDENGESVASGTQGAIRERISCQTGTGSLWNVRSQQMANKPNQRYCSETHLLDGAGEHLLSGRSLGQLPRIPLADSRRPSKPLEQLEDSFSRAGGESLGTAKQLDGSDPVQAGSSGRAHSVTNSNHSDFGMVDAMMNDLDIDIGDSNFRQGVTGEARAAGEEVCYQEQDQYCERHQLDQDNRLRLDCELIDDQYGTDEDVGDELLSSNNHKQQTMADSRLERDVESQANGSYEFMSDQSGGDLEDSEANLLIEYGDLDDEAQVYRTNTFRLVRLEAGLNNQGQAERRDDNGAATTSHRSHGDNIKSYDSLNELKVIAQPGRISNNNTTRTNSMDTKYHQMHHLNRLFRSTGDKLSDRQANDRQRLATRRARYRKLQSVANMVAMTKLAQTNKGPSRSDRPPSLAAKDSGGNVQTVTRDQRKSHWHQQISSPSGTDESDVNGLMMWSGKQAAMGMPFTSRLVKPNWQQTEIQQQQQTQQRRQRQLCINQAEVVEKEDNYDEVSRGCKQGQRLNTIKIKFRTEEKRSQEAQYDHLEQINQVRQRQQQQLVDDASQANGQLVHQSSDCDHGDHDDKNYEGLINGFLTYQSLDDEVRNSGDCASNDPDEEPCFNRSSLVLSSLTNSSNTLSASLCSSTQPNSDRNGPKNNTTRRLNDRQTASCHEENRNSSLSDSKCCLHCTESTRRNSREEPRAKESEVEDAKSLHLSSNGTGSFGWETNNLACKKMCPDTAAKPAAKKGGDAYEIGRHSDDDGWKRQTVAKVKGNDEIDLQSCRQSNGTEAKSGTAAVPNVSAARAATTAAVKVVAGEKIPFSLSSSLLVRKSPTVYLINNNINSQHILAKQQSFKATKLVVVD